MKQLKGVAVSICLLSGAAFAQDNVHLRGSDTLKDYTTALLSDSGCTGGPLEGPLHYDGGGSATGISRLIQARTPPVGEASQRVAPASRAVSPTEMSQAAANNLDFVDHVLALDAVTIIVNDAGNPARTRMLLSSARQIWTCDPGTATWDQVPGSDRTDAIDVQARDEASGTTDNFTSRIGGFTTTGDRWWDNYPCVTVCR